MTAQKFNDRSWGVPLIMQTEKVNINTVKVGDMVEHNGVLKTVGACNIGGDKFIGRTLWGDSYNCGHKLVTRVSFSSSPSTLMKSN